MKNADASKERILDAALVEFAAHGVAGARVDRIATAAKCNKNLIYIYFESKENLFATVLKKNLAAVYNEVPFTPDDLSDYAARAFDLAIARPELMRLVAWYALEQPSSSMTERDATRDIKIEALTTAQKSKQVGNAFPPGFLLTAIMALATAWGKSAPFSALDPIGDKHPLILRKHIREAVRLLTVAKKA